MIFRRRSAPVSTLRTKLQQRLVERESAAGDDEAFELSEQFADAGKDPFPGNILGMMHRHFMLKLIAAVALVLLAAVLLRGGYSGGEPLLGVLRFVVEWDLDPGILTEKGGPAFRLLLDRLELPAIKPQALILPGRESLPLAGTLVSGYGLRADPGSGAAEMHYGIDLAAPEGTAVRALQEGRVEQIITERHGPVVVIIATEPGWTMLYRGIKEAVVKEGEALEKGALLGVLGPAWHHEGPHLHFELRFGGRPVAPPAPWTESSFTPAERI
jgi:murein DD-endopeptidase MepM/ murein hydrolase activator NlpD